MASIIVSPSPRKAWIETYRQHVDVALPGRLPPGRRGLKLLARRPRSMRTVSPSPRKAWIETYSYVRKAPRLNVAFPPEGVD